MLIGQNHGLRQSEKIPAFALRLPSSVDFHDDLEKRLLNNPVAAKEGFKCQVSIMNTFPVRIGAGHKQNTMTTLEFVSSSSSNSYSSKRTTN